MNIVQCKICRKPFQSYGGKVCHDCLEQVEKDFLIIRDFLYENTGAINAEELAEKTGVASAIVLHLMEENRLFPKSPSDNSGQCQLCGTPISSGKICASCNGLLTSGLKSNSVQDGSAKTSKYAKMHINRDK